MNQLWVVPSELLRHEPSSARAPALAALGGGVISDAVQPSRGVISNAVHPSQGVISDAVQPSQGVISDAVQPFWGVTSNAAPAQRP